MSRAGRWKSEAQANAEALARRETTYSEASGVSFRVNWDWHNREPRDLREAVRMVRAAYQDEVPARLHNQDLADDGTPKMTPQAEGYIFGSDSAGESVTKCACPRNVPAWHGGDNVTPAEVEAARPIIEAAMRERRTVVEIGSGLTRRTWVFTGGHLPSCPRAHLNLPALDFYRTPFRAALAHLERHNPPKARIVQHVSVGSLNPVEAAMRAGVPYWCAKLVAEDVLRAFLRNLTDIKVHLPREDAAA